MFLCCFDPITSRHKEDEFQKENGILFGVHECLIGILRYGSSKVVVRLETLLLPYLITFHNLRSLKIFLSDTLVKKDVKNLKRCKHFLEN